MCGFHIHVVSHTHPCLLLLFSGNATNVSCFFDPLVTLLQSLLPQQFPLEWEWWAANVLSSVVMASLGEYLCSRNELEDIPLYMPS